MTTRNLHFMLHPGSVAVIGASERPGSVGATVMRNVLEGGFAGPVWPVNARHASVAGRAAFRSAFDLPAAPDLAVICTPPAAVPGVVADLGRCGTRAAVVLTGGLSSTSSGDGRTLTEAVLDAARPHLLRVLGPDSVGVLVPGIGLNASFAHVPALPGNIAFVSQSGALTTAMLDWARSSKVGFSHFIALGDSADVDFGDLLDYLGSDPGTRAILLYIEAVTAARKFMSAARAAARNKPVIAVKAGRVPEAARAATSHTGALAGSDDVHEAALARAGILRVASTLDLFDAAETLARLKPPRGDRLAILANGGGPAVMATDALIAEGGRLATLGEATLRALDRLLPAAWSRANPVDIIGDAPAGRYAGALRALLADPAADAVLFIHAPTAIVPADEIARACVPLLDGSRSVFACWLGGAGIGQADAIFTAAGIPTYATPESAVRGFLTLVKYRRNQERLMQTPPSIAEGFVPDRAAARTVIDAALGAGRQLLGEYEAKQLLAAYGIPVVETRIAASADEAARVAVLLGFPVALKILSPDIIHKSDVGGVALNLESAQDVRAAAEAMERRCAERLPQARLAGFTVQRMVRRGGARELILGAATDRVFGPVILFGQGGTAVEAIADRAVELPPLNLALARELVQRTRVARLLRDYPAHPAADLSALHLALVKISQLIADLPEVVELDVNPLLADEKGIVALDARMRVVRTAAAGAERFAIRPYPAELEQWIEFGGRRVLLRPIRPEDEPQHRELLGRVTLSDVQFRFFYARREFSHTELARFTQIDYDREMAFIATSEGPGGASETLGVVRAIADPDNVSAEFAILVRSDIKGQGLGRALLGKIIRYCRDRGTRTLFGEVLSSNHAMLRLVTGLGFAVSRAPPDLNILKVALDLDRAEPSTAAVRASGGL
jgi:acetyltransferase